MAISISRVSTLPTQLSGYLPGSRVVLPNGKEYILNNSKLWIPIHMMALEIKDNLTTESLNDVIIPGIYHNEATANATLLKFYPADGLSAGVLKVYASNNQIFQTYTILSGQLNEDKTFTRGKYGGAWSGWKVPNYINITQAEWNSVNTNNHTHANKTLLDSYTQTNAGITSAVTNSHSHANKTLLDTYTQTNVNLANAVTNSHTHSNKTQLDDITAQKITNWDAAHTWGNHSDKGYLTLIVADTKYIKVVGLQQELDGDIKIIDTVNENKSFFASGVSYASIKFDTLSLSGFGLTTKLINSSSMKYHLGISTYSFITSTTTTLSFIEYDDNLMKWTIGQDNFVYFNPLKLGTAGGIRTLTIDAAGKLGYVEGLPISSYTETDPTVPAHVKSISLANVSAWNSSVLNYLNYIENRTIKPNAVAVKTLQFGFGAIQNNNAGPIYTDFLHFGGYQDGSGGNQNLIMFNKGGFGIRQYQGTAQANVAYSSFVDYWNSGDFTSANVSAWNLAVTNNHTHSNKTQLDNINQNLGTTHSPTFVDLISKTLTLNSATKLTDITAYGTGYHQMVQFSNVSGAQKLWSGAVADSVGSYLMNNAYYNNLNAYIPNYTSASGVHFKNNGEIHFIADTGLTSGTAYTPTAKMWINPAGVVGIPNSLTVTNQITSAGLNKTGSSNLYVLLGASGHKLISDFWLKTDFNSTTVTNWGSAYTYSQVGHIPLSQKAVANGVATLDGNGKIPAAQLPAAQSTGVTFANGIAFFPTTGSSDMLYVIRTTGQIFKWIGSAYLEVTAKIISVTYLQLIDIASSYSLIPGMKYRITDYTAFTDPNAVSFSSAKNRFDIIVTALSDNKLSENASAIRCDTDPANYFPEYTNFAAWEIKYTIFNDISKYDWVDGTDGRGVIYYMKDDNNNECGYDFKSIRFRRFGISSSQTTLKNYLTVNGYDIESSQYKQRLAWSTTLQAPYGDCVVDAFDQDLYYTFNHISGTSGTYGTNKDQSTFNFNDNFSSAFLGSDFLYNLNEHVFASNNIIKPYIKKVVKNDRDYQIQYLNNIVLAGTRKNDNNNPNSPIINNIFKPNCKNMTFFGASIVSNEIGSGSFNNIFGARAMFNKADSQLQNNCFGHETQTNKLGNRFINNNIESGFEHNNIGNNFQGNYINFGFYSNYIGHDFVSNTSEGGFIFNNIGNDTNANYFEGDFNYNNIGNDFHNNEIGNSNSFNSFGNSIMNFNIGSNNEGLFIGNNISNINIGNNKGTGGPSIEIDSNVKPNGLLIIDSYLLLFVHAPKKIKIMSGSIANNFILEQRVSANLTEAIDVIP